MRSFKQRGFTLIEILVAVAIFIMITAVAMVSYQTANRRARDGRRQADLEQVRSALEIYRADNAVYPSTNWAALVAALQPTYLSTIPVDPRSYSYYYSSDGTTYSLCAYLESGGSVDCGANCSAPGNCNYRVINP
ncbi:MAG: hypothetical protein A2785_02570 [Candidatus Chisholmbacteria bacterium RIFCSPHIGHO2_01_FULL_49_18]|uniref:Type II secretion system protein GspG C-terminal domain-containing protein n=2 Tax=Candidatus Chisholmiibacteriota TaxID=1817900 RepID=A0A1G1VPF8_9BACT|nr:MAG: hypothetical protein A2785_02570 [Candidatus Chisholmbacteria bacterium RIFCSPHIGHO2_01_FULL_49_18]OGY22164.1 MAG: hypothetical protein A3A65_06555 [Candidatus Chisholmbacteria bacterium RIFCSPLOWO2_01_FULL_49_14]